MSLRNSIRAGQAGILRVQFVDIDGQPIEAQNVSVNIFNPNQNKDLDTPVFTLTPTYIGNGVFQVSVTPTGIQGLWLDVWSGEILGTPTTAVQTFSVLATGTIKNYPVHGLFQNTFVEITIPSFIKSLDAQELKEDYSFKFTTTYSPLYSSVRKVKLEAGSLLGNIVDDTINLAILEASIEADILTFRREIVNQNVYVHARREYVTCAAANVLAQNVLASGGVLKSKMLADFKVDYDTSILKNLLDKLNTCMDKWSKQVESGGGARTIRNPKMVIKGELDPDRPAIGRTWHQVAPGEEGVGNIRYRNPGSRRFKTGWIERSKNGGGGRSEW